MAKCYTCGEEFQSSVFRVLCIDCEEKRISGEIKAWIIFFACLIAIVIGCRVLYAKFVYDDMRCAIAECRLMK